MNSGSLQVNGDGVSQTVTAGRAVLLTGANPVQISAVQLPIGDILFVLVLLELFRLLLNQPEIGPE